MPRRGEVWLVDLGLAQKIRPALILSTAYSDADRALITVISHTTKIRGSRFELPLSAAVSQARPICCAKRYHNSGEACVAATRRTLSRGIKSD
jgi:mRNA-degrading endonuclease toxin of MazEF toxin-antitoxin module